MKPEDVIIRRINKLPTLPTVYATLSSVLQDPRASSDKVAHVLGTDQVSVGKILKVANSPFFGFRGKIDTITQAIMYLGFNEVRNIVFALTVMDFFSKDKVLQAFKPVEFWGHSIATGIAARMIGRAAGEKSVEHFFLGGIIHDLGKLLCLEVSKNDYAQVLEKVERENIEIREAEKSVLGYDHCYAGELLAKKWKLPQNLVDVIADHHIGIKEGKSEKIVATVHLANIVARVLKLGHPGDSKISKPNEKIWNILQLPDGFFTSMRKTLIDDYERTTKIMLFNRE